MSQGQGKGGSADQRKQGPAPKGAPAASSTRASSASLPGVGGGEHLLSELKTDASVLTKHQKNQLGSNFADSSAERRRNSLLATAIPSVGANPFADDEPTGIAQKFDGKEVPAQLMNRDVWKAVQAPLQSREGKRSREVYEMLVKQFGVLTNPRYDDDAPGKIRGHIFVWDVSRAMNCEIPHFVGAKELSLAQTCDWLRHEGPMRGWKRVMDTDIIDMANAGKLVVALPRELKNKQIAIVRPQDTDDGVPRLTGVCLKRAEDAHPRDMFGARAMDCYYHD